MANGDPLPSPTLPTGRDVTLYDADGNEVATVTISGQLSLVVFDNSATNQLDAVLEKLDRIIQLLEQRND